MTHEASLPLQLKELKLPGFYQYWESAAERARTEKWTFGETLSFLCHLEIQHRHDSRLKRRVKESRLPSGKVLSSFDFKANTSVSAEQIQALSGSDSWVRKGDNIIIFGPSGVGKTHLAAAIAYRQIELGSRVRFYQTYHLVQMLQQAKNQLRLKEALARLDNIALLVLDDMGYVKKDEHETSVLFELICQRYETGSLIITANQPFSDWEHIFPENMMAVASIDRLVHHATVISIEGESYRMKNRKH